MPDENRIDNLANKIDGGAKKISQIMAIIAAFVLGIMMMLTVADVIGRYFFNSPINGSWELTGFLLVCAGTWGLAFCQNNNSHIRVTVLLDTFPRLTRNVIHVIANLTGLIAFGLICWRSVELTRKYIVEPGHVSDTLQIPYYPFTILLVAGTGMLVIMLFIHFIQSLCRVFQK